MYHFSASLSHTRTSFCEKRVSTPFRGMNMSHINDTDRMEPSRLPKQYSTIVIDKKAHSVSGSVIDVPSTSSSISPDTIQPFPHDRTHASQHGSILALPPPPPGPPLPPKQPRPPPPIAPTSQSQLHVPIYDGPSGAPRLGPTAAAAAARSSKSRSKSHSSSRGRRNNNKAEQQHQRRLNLPRRAASLALARLQERLAIDFDRERYPFCLVWTPLPLVSLFLPIIGHTGISNSQGLISDFSRDFHVDLDNFAFGSPTKYYQFDPDEIDLHAAQLVPAATAGKSKSKSESSKRKLRELANQLANSHPNHTGVRVSPSEWQAAQGDLDKRALIWDCAIREASEYYKEHKYDLYFRNCHAYIACVLNKCNYAGANDWTPSDVWWMISFMSSYTNSYAWFRQWSLFCALILGVIVLIVILAT